MLAGRRDAAPRHVSGPVPETTVTCADPRSPRTPDPVIPSRSRERSEWRRVEGSLLSQTAVVARDKDPSTPFDRCAISRARDDRERVTRPGDGGGASARNDRRWTGNDRRSDRRDEAALAFRPAASFHQPAAIRPYVQSASIVSTTMQTALPGTQHPRYVPAGERTGDDSLHPPLWIQVRLSSRR